MLLTDNQKEYIKNRRKQIRECLALEPKIGWLGLQFELQQLNIMVDLHNVEMNQINKEKKDGTVRELPKSD